MEVKTFYDLFVFRWRRIAFFFSMRLSSLFEMNQRLRRTSARTLLLTTALLKRRSSCSGDSLDFSSTLGSFLTPFLYAHIVLNQPFV